MTGHDETNPPDAGAPPVTARDSSEATPGAAADDADDASVASPDDASAASATAPGDTSATPVALPDDASDTRVHHFRHLSRHPLTLVLGGILVAGATVGGTAGGGTAIGAGAGVAALLLVVLIVWLLASGRAADDFFDAYARTRGLVRIDAKSPLPPLTPLLQKGDRRYSEERFNGRLAGDLDGSLCLYTYEETTRDSDGNRQTTYVHFTIVVTQLPEAAALIQELFCQRRFGFRFLDSAEDVFRKRQRVEHESENVDKRFEIFTGRNDDLNRARQILSPSFLVWLDEHSPEAFAFELSAGALVTNVKGHKKSAGELDSLCQASAAVARRIREEAAELV